jgi:plasmid stabilization system protein ParE
LKRVIRTKTYQDDLDDIQSFIAKDNFAAALDTWFLIDDQVEKLSDPKFPRRVGRVTGTFELVAHENYIVIFEEDSDSVTVLNVVHVRQQWPSKEKK